MDIYLVFVHPDPKSLGQDSIVNCDGANSGMHAASAGAPPAFVIAIRPV